MGGDGDFGDLETLLFSFFSDDDSSLEEDFPDASSIMIPPSSRDGLNMKVEVLKDGTVNTENGLLSGKFCDANPPLSSAPFSDFEAKQKRKDDVYREILGSYDEQQFHGKELEEAKAIILSYNPGMWIEKVGGMVMSDYNVPTTTSLLLVGPKGSGKSSLINRISKVFEDDKYASERAQVSYNSSDEDGTQFLREYMIPRSASKFCLYDTRSLCDDISDNENVFKRWMTKGVHHGEIVIRDSDSLSSKSRMKCKARQNDYYSCETRMVNFVIFVIDGLSVLKSIETNDEEGKQYSKLITKTFSCPYLSFKDDKPVVVVTHGDLLSLSNRVRIRMHLGELLGISPVKQIFDIPERSDPVTERTIVNMIRYALEHADRNIPHKNWVKKKIGSMRHPLYMHMVICVGMIIAVIVHHVHPHLLFLNQQPVTDMLHMHRATPQPEADMSHMHFGCPQPEADLPQMPQASPQPEADLPQMQQASPPPEADLHQMPHHRLEADLPQMHQYPPRPKTKLPKKLRARHPPEAPVDEDPVDWGSIRHLWVGP